MDAYATASTAVVQIYKITIFIRGVVREIKGYEAYTHEVEAKLEHEFLFLEDFKRLLFEDDNAEISYTDLPDIHKKDIQNILEALSRILSQHALLAIKHGFNIVGAQETAESLKGSALPTKTQSPPTSGWRTRIQQVRAKFTQLEWALFDRDTILKMLSDYSEWNQRLRQTMIMILLVNGSLGSAKKLEIADRSRGKDLGLDRIVERQIRAEDLRDVASLDESLITDRKLPQKLYQLARYRDSSGSSSIPVLLEKYPLGGRHYNYYTEAEQKTIRDTVLQPVRSLAALLCGTTRAVGEPGAEDPLKTLECIGYSDQAYPDHALLIYKYPFADNDVRSLHSQIQDSAKPALGYRFFLAYSICLSMLGIHLSGWVHKGLCSEGILLLADIRSSDLIPNLIGWGAARRIVEAGVSHLAFKDEESFDLMTNIYRHAERYGKPQRAFVPAHDLYSLGVVLLEIGCWRTMSARFEKPIRVAQAKRQLPPAVLVREHLLSVARSPELSQEMGVEYALAVERCLLMNFEIKDDDDSKYTLLMRNFRELVIEKLARGLSL